MARTAERQAFEVPVRVSLLEVDADRHELELVTLNDRLGKVLWALLGILISTTTAAVLLAMNLAVGR